MNAVIPIVVPNVVHRGSFSGGGEMPEFVANMPLILGAPWCIFLLLSIIGMGLTLTERINIEAYKFIGWGVTILGTYTLFYCVFYLIRYLIGR